MASPSPSRKASTSTSTSTATAEILWYAGAVGLGVAGAYYLYRTLCGASKEEETTEAETEAAAADVEELPVVDLNLLFQMDQDQEAYRRECQKVADALHRFGCLVVRDPRVDFEDNQRFLDMMERYFEQSDGKADARPELSFQVGVTPEHREVPRNHCPRVNKFSEQNAALTPCPPEPDPKWRFFWRIGPRPENTRFETLNMDPVIPEGFPEWESTMNMWGNKMIMAVRALARMAAEGFGLEHDAFTRRMEFGPHLLAPTGSNFNKYGELGTVLAGFHYDLNFLTIHGKSRFPGLYIWLRDGTRVPVRVPDGCLLVQAGKQIEYLTGGHVLAGFHEVVVSDRTVNTIARRRAEGKSLWRVSSTLFSHISSDERLEPLGRFRTPQALEQFPPKFTGDQVQDELNAIHLGAGFSLNDK